MTRQEFTKFIKTLNKSDLVKIVLDLTKRKSDVQEKIFLEYSKQVDISIDLEEIIQKFNDIPRQVFTKNFMFIHSKEVGQYCRAANKLIKTYIDPLIKRKEYYTACYLLQEAYYSVLENLAFSLYKYSSSDSFLNKLENSFDKCISDASPLERVKIARLIEDNLSRDIGDPWFSFGMQTVYENYFSSEEWENEKKEILEDKINSFLDSFDENRPASDEFSELALELLRVHLDDESSQEEIDAYVKKYKFLGDIIRFEANTAIKDSDFKKAKMLLKDAESLPTLSQNQLYKNSNLLISILNQESEVGKVSDSKTELLAELKKNLNTFYQASPENLITYFFYSENDELDSIYDEFKTKETTKDLYQGNPIEEVFIVIKALKNRDFKELDSWKESFIISFSRFDPKLVADYFINKINEVMKAGATDTNYRTTKELLALLFETPTLKETYENCKKELKEKYPKRSKLKKVFKEVENGQTWW